MALTYSVPGVYSRPRPRVAPFPRLRTDVVGFVGAAGPNHLGTAVRVDDWRGYVEEFLRDLRGDPVEPPAGSVLGRTVRDFFANGGSRCWVVNVAQDLSRPQVLLQEMLGIGSSEEVHGLELLLRQEEVSMVVLPELDARLEVRAPRSDPAVPRGPHCFVPCSRLRGPIPPWQLPPETVASAPLYTDTDYLWAQRYLISRIQRQAWRWFAILAPPPGRDHGQAVRWRERLTAGMGDVDWAALYWPWVIAQEKPGAPIELRSPVGSVAGIFARRDIAHGPHSAPANERLAAAVGLEHAVDDGTNAAAYDGGVNVIRAFPGGGIRVWGARTLQWSELTRNAPLSYVNARRCLSAIQRTAERIGQQSVFEPLSPLLRLQVGQALTGYLLRVFEAGALLGDTPEQAFFVRCDASNNPPELAREGQLVSEVGVALAAPAEFIVFRLGRKEGVTEIEEVA